MKKIFKVIGVMILIIILLFIGLIFIISFVPAVPKNYTNDVKTGGDIEKKYIAMGSYDVKDIKIKATELTKYNYVYYPEELETADKEYPVVIVLNGTGILPKKYKALFKHLASWGFIVVGNDDGSTGFGKSADETMDYIIIAGTQGDFETKLVIPVENMIDMYNKIPSSKVMMRRMGKEHGQMLYSSDGYVTA